MKQQCIRQRLQQGIAGTVLLNSILCGVAVLFCFAQPVRAQPCDNTLNPIENWALKYRERENRCEGFYQVQPGAGGLDIVGVIDGTFRFMSDANEVITVSAPRITDKTIAIRSVGIPMKTYYRVDAQLTPGKALTWPVQEVILPGGLSSQSMGVFGWIGDEQNKTYIPVKAMSKLNPVDTDGEIRLYVRPTVDVNNVQWRSGDIKNGATSGLSEYKIIDPATYSPGEAIEIVLPPSKTGELYIEVAAQIQDAADWLNVSANILVGRK